jgi:hypothetical protein
MHICFMQGSGQSFQKKDKHHALFKIFGDIAEIGRKAGKSEDEGNKREHQRISGRGAGHISPEGA